jgi:CHRD domain-containing protein
MKRRALFISAAIGLLFVGSLSAQTLGAVLSSAQETPPCTASGFGNATVTFDSARQNINVTITVSNLGSPITASHIHRGAVGVAGPVVIGFTPAASFSNGTLTGTFAITSDLATEILQNPGNFYVNVHTSACGGGAARGQLAFVSGGPIMYAAQLRGANENPANSSTAFGSSLVTLDPNNSTIAFEVSTSGIAAPSASHIHRGAAGTNGPVIINFATGPTGFQAGRVTGGGAISALQSSSFLASDLTGLSSASTANGFYVNVHSTAFPGGEIRGQLVPAQELDVPVAGHVTNGIGQTFITDVRIFNPSFDTPTTALIEFFPAGTTPNTNASASMAVNLPARGTAVLNDVAGTTGLNVTGTGALRISSASNVVATSRIFVNTSTGSFGQFVPAFSRASALRRGVIPQVSNTSAATGFRGNLGLFNPNQSPVTVRLEARDPAGAVVASNLITLQALSQQQNAIGVLFPGVDISNSSNLTVSFDASAGIFAYVSEVDNSSGDSFLISAQPDPGVAAQQQ